MAKQRLPNGLSSSLFKNNWFGTAGGGGPENISSGGDPNCSSGSKDSVSASAASDVIGTGDDDDSIGNTGNGNGDNDASKNCVSDCNTDELVTPGIFFFIKSGISYQNVGFILNDSLLDLF